MKNNRLLACVLAASLLITPVYAEENNEQPGKDPEPIASKQEEKSTFSINSYTLLNEKGEEISTLQKGEKATLVIDATDNTISTKDALEAQEIDQINQSIHSLNIDRLTDGFSKGGSIQVILLSKGEEPLKVKIIFKDISWKGKSDTFRFRMGYSALNIGYSDQAITIVECGSEEPKQEEPADPEQPVDIPFIDSGSSFAGSSDTYTSTPVKSASPNLIVKKYSYGKDPIYSGKEFTLSIEFYNTSKSLATENIVVALETAEGLSITNSSNTFYFESLGPQASQTIQVKMKALTLEKNSSPTVDVAFRYDFVEDNERTNQQMGEKISIPVYLKDRFEINEPTLPQTAIAGSECVVSFSYVNKGKSVLSNVEAKVEGDIPALQSVQHIGNIESGNSGTIDVILVPEQEGPQKATIVISYENANEEVVEEKFPIELNVEPMQMIDQPIEEPLEQQQSSIVPWIVAILVLIVIGALFFFKKRKKKKDQKQEDEDLDFDDDDEDQS